MKPVTLFRAEGGATIGLGHIMRCLALAEAMMAQGEDCHFVVASPAAPLIDRLQREGVTVHSVGEADHEAAQTLEIARDMGARGFVVDGYGFSDRWRHNLRAAKLPILAFADAPAYPDHADLLLDAAAQPSHDPTKLFGRDYVMLRGEIVVAAQLPPLPMTERRSILVTFGGADPLVLTVPVVAALTSTLPDVMIDAVIGGAVPDLPEVVAAVTALGVNVHVAVESLGMLMRQAGLAVTAGGGTIGELAAVGVPIVLVVVADNQLTSAKAAEAAGWCSVIDARTTPDAVAAIVNKTLAAWGNSPERARQADLARSLVDIGGANRAAQAFIRYLNRGGNL